MSCRLWVEKALPFLEGTLGPADERIYSAHLAECAFCRAEVDEGRHLIRGLRDLPSPALPPRAIAAFDAAVFRRIAPLAMPAARDHRAAAAAAIAARSRQAGRPEFTVRSSLPSLTAASLGLAAVSIVATLVFGEWIVRALRASFGLAFTAFADGGEWFVERMGVKIVEAVTLARILSRATADLGPWAEAVRQFVATRGGELTVATILVTVLLGVVALVLRRDRRKAREISRS